MMDQSLAMGISAALKRLPFEQRLPDKLWEPGKKEPACGNLFGKSAFSASCRKLYPNVSQTEADNIYNTLESVWSQDTHKGGLGLFSLIREFAQHHILMTGTDLYCRNADLLQWRETIHGIGQTPFICAFLAAQDVVMGQTRERYAFGPLLRTDDFRLRQILSRGTAENHFHLKGSAPAFLNNWVCLMNHSTHRADSFKDFGAQLNNISPDVADKLSYYVRMAAGFRVLLWGMARKRTDEEKNIKDVSVESSLLRQFKWGFPCQQDLIAREKALVFGSLDYTLHTGSVEDVYAGIAGENCFQYTVFRELFSRENKMLLAHADMFYAYLSIYCLLRSELTQDNNAVGFENFSNFQDRKEVFIDEKRYPNNNRSFIKMAFESALSPWAASVEARISPPNNTNALKKTIKDYLPHLKSEKTKECRICDNYSRIRGSCELPLCESRPARVFFVLHLPKMKDTYIDTYIKRHKGKTPLSVPHRHEDYIRKRVNPQIDALIELREKHPGYARHIYAIDACALEIGCRPEVFSPAFRRARQPLTRQSKRQIHEDFNLPGLHITYHVGEDFLDLADGLRAIDEAVRFLQMHSADRLGHALALAVSARDFYQKKNNKVFLPRHDLLDNVMWMEMKLRHFRFSFSNLSHDLRQVFREQYIYIYDHTDSVPDMEDFFDSWLLRGDDPSYYRQSWKSNNNFEGYLNTAFCLKKNFESDLSQCAEAKRIREQSIMARGLFHRYHYDPEARKRGGEIVEWNITSQYIHAVSLLQQEMQRELAALGIGIECNPSSNVLIGTFKDYREHPIFTFNNDGLDDGTESALLQVSINTDDQGVFDTDLENEFALIACALREKTDEHGNPLYTPHNIYKYIDNVRQMGLDQSFKLLQHNLTGGVQNGNYKV